MSAEGQFLCGLACWEALKSLGWSVTHAGGLTMGADPVAYALAHRSWIERSPLDAFSVRKTPKGHGTGQEIEGGLPADAGVVVVEDSLTSGASALQATRAIEAHGATVRGILALVDREEGARERIERAGYELHTLFTAAELLEVARRAAD
jgi:orotate phosphoribosyltransferase